MSILSAASLALICALFVAAYAFALHRAGCL